MNAGEGGTLRAAPPMLAAEEQIKEIEVWHASILAQRTVEELAERDVPALVAEIRRPRDLAASRQAHRPSLAAAAFEDAISDAQTMSILSLFGQRSDRPLWSPERSTPAPNGNSEIDPEGHSTGSARRFAESSVRMKSAQSIHLGRSPLSRGCCRSDPYQG